MSARETAQEAAREVDVHTLPTMLAALRLPSFTRHWQNLAEQADAEAWPATRFLATLAERELAERETRRIRRRLNASRLPGGKTLASFDFKALPNVPRKRIEALAAGDWLEPSANLIATGQLGRRRQDASSLRHRPHSDRGRPPRALHPHHRPRPKAPGRPPRPRRRDLALEAALARLDKFDLVRRRNGPLDRSLFLLTPRRHRPCPEGPGRDLGALRAHRAPLRDPQPRRHRQSALQRLGPHLPRPRPRPAVTAVDRLVHHATILERNVDSRRRSAATRHGAEAIAPPTTPADNHEGARWAEPTSTAAASKPAIKLVSPGQKERRRTAASMPTRSTYPPAAAIASSMAPGAVSTDAARPPGPTSP